MFILSLSPVIVELGQIEEQVGITKQLDSKTDKWQYQPFLLEVKLNDYLIKEVIKLTHGANKVHSHHEFSQMALLSHVFKHNDIFNLLAYLLVICVNI